MYRYDLHCHTIEGSKCSRMSAAEMVQYYIDQGYAGFCVTDHFTGSTTVPDDAPWEERIDRYYDGYEAACKAAEGKNITVFFGVEHSLAKYGTKQMSQAAGNDFLIFGLSREWLKANEAVFNLPGDQLLDAVRAAGGYVIHAHPFLEAFWIERIQLFPRKVDAVEIYNAGVSDEVNARAQWYAQSYGIKTVGGSDLHRPSDKLSGVETEKPCSTIEELIEELRADRAKAFVIESKK